MADETNPRMDYEKAFSTGSIVNASDEELIRYLGVACSGGVLNPNVHPREIVRGITINHIQTARVIDRLETTIRNLDAQNSKNQRLVTWLAIVAIILSVVQVVPVVAAWFK